MFQPNETKPTLQNRRFVLGKIRRQVDAAPEKAEGLPSGRDPQFVRSIQEGR